jgi:hypothetical protein
MRRSLMLPLMAGIALSIAATPALAAENGGKPQKKERLICKREVTTGSNARSRRTCLTAEQWAQSEQYNKQTLSDWKNKMDGAQRAN